MSTTQIQQNVNLQPFNTFGIQVAARYFATMNQIEDLQTILQTPDIQDVPKFILGGGSNVLFTQDFPGLMIRNQIMGKTKVAEDDDQVWLQIGAGENWHQLVLHCIEEGYSGLENLSLIPGTVGAAPIQNIGAYGAELCDVFHELTAVNLQSGAVETFDHERCQFNYRDSVFKSTYKNQYVIATVTLRLNKRPAFNLSYGALQSTLEEMCVSELTLRAVSDAVIHIRRSKLPDPNVLGNAGSFFKNPVIPLVQFELLRKDYPNIPYFLTDSDDTIKISAGWMIEQCGWKGVRRGDVGVYDKQALVIVNYGAATGEAIKDLFQQVQYSVEKQFGILLQPEVNVI